MLLVAPDPRLGIAPERIARVRVLLDSAPRAAGIAVALPGGADGVLDALVVRPDAVLGLVPAAGTDGSREGVAELERLLALADPAPTAPRRVVAVPGGGDTPGGAQRALGAPVAAPVLAADEIRRLFRALRLTEHTPGSDALTAAGFPGHTAAVPATAPAAALVGAGGPPVVVEAAPTTPVPTRPPGDAGDEAPPGPDDGAPDGRDPDGRDPDGRDPDDGALRGAGGLAALGLADAPAPRRGGDRAAPPVADGPGSWPSTGRLPAAGDTGGRSRVPAWVWSWRGLAVAAALTFLVASTLALLVGRSAVPAVAPAAVADPGATVALGGVTYTRQAAATDTSCVGHSYGLAARFLAERPCRELDRTLWSGASAQGPTVLAVSVVRMGDAASAAALKSLIDSSGTGNLADLLREGRSYPGVPAGLTEAGYASAIAADTVVIAESDWTDPARSDEPTLDGYARQAVDAGVGRP